MEKIEKEYWAGICSLLWGILGTPLAMSLGFNGNPVLVIFGTLFFLLGVCGGFLTICTIMIMNEMPCAGCIPDEYKPDYEED